MKVPDTFCPDKNLDDKTEDLIQGAKIISNPCEETGLLFVQRNYNLMGWHIDLKEPKPLLFSGSSINDLVIHENSIIYSVGKSVFREHEGLITVFFYRAGPLASFNKDIYIVCGKDIYKNSDNEKVVSRETEVLDLFVFNDRLYDLTVNKEKGKSYIHETLPNKKALILSNIFVHAASLENKVYFSDETGCIYNGSTYIKTPSSYISSLAAGGDELFFSGTGLEGRILAFNPKNNKFRIAVETGDLFDIRSIVPAHYSLIEANRFSMRP